MHLGAKKELIHDHTKRHLLSCHKLLNVFWRSYACVWTGYVLVLCEWMGYVPVLCEWVGYILVLCEWTGYVPVLCEWTGYVPVLCYVMGYVLGLSGWVSSRCSVCLCACVSVHTSVRDLVYMIYLKSVLRDLIQDC